jgi:hypothetical protein
MELTKFCEKCGLETELVSKLCPACRVDVFATRSATTPRLKDSKPKRSLLKAVGIPLTLVIGAVVGGAGVPFVQNLSNFLQPEEVSLELQVGRGSSAWLFTGNNFRAKVDLPHKLSDKALVKLERFASGKWVQEDSEELAHSSTISLLHRYSTTKKEQLRVALYSGDRLIQTSNVKTVQGIKRPKNSDGMAENVVYRYFSQKEYDSVSTPGCGSYCWGIWVSTPIKSRLALWIESAIGKRESKKVYFTLTKVGVYQKVIFPALSRNSRGTLKLTSRPATAQEIRAGNKASNASETTVCRPFTELLDERKRLKHTIAVLSKTEDDTVIYGFLRNCLTGNYSAGDSGDWWFEEQCDSLLAAKKRLLEVESQINSC